jgi:hypothetical protein
MEAMMPGPKSEFRQALAGIVDARAREATRTVTHRREHLLLGALTKRPA